MILQQESVDGTVTRMRRHDTAISPRKTVYTTHTTEKAAAEQKKKIEDFCQKKTRLDRATPRGSLTRGKFSKKFKKRKGIGGGLGGKAYCSGPCGRSVSR